MITHYCYQVTLLKYSTSFVTSTSEISTPVFYVGGMAVMILTVLYKNVSRINIKHPSQIVEDDTPKVTICAYWSILECMPFIF